MPRFAHTIAVGSLAAATIVVATSGAAAAASEPIASTDARSSAFEAIGVEPRQMLPAPAIYAARVALEIWCLDQPHPPPCW